MYNCPEEERRTAMLLGNAALEHLHASRVAVFGVGGVGGYVCEALARAGVGHLTLIDNDVISLSNLNRQIIALHSTVGRPKVEVMRERILDIQPDCDVTAIRQFYLPENADSLPLEQFHYLVDAIDTVSAKIELAVRASRLGIPLISAMGTGRKGNAQGFFVTDLAKTAGDPLARVMRRELRQRGIPHLKVVTSAEAAMPTPVDAPAPEGTDGTRVPPGSLPYMPGIAGLMLAGEVIRELSQFSAPDANGSGQRSTLLHE